MQQTPSDTSSALPVPRVVRKKRRNQGWVWLIPIAAALIGLSIVWHQVSNRGPTITISFLSASGLVEGKTQIKYRDVVVGVVQDIRLSDDRERVLVEALLDKEASGLANAGSVFWVVRPSIGLDGVSGLATLFSGAYIETDSEGSFHASPRIYEFEGLERAPPIKNDRPGQSFRLKADSLGSVTEGTPIYYRRIPVGIVTGYSLDKSGNFLYLDVFVDAPYDKYVNANTRFWNESGIYFNINADGLTVRTESLASIVSGGLAFANFGPDKPIASDMLFKLFSDRRQADSVPSGLSIPIDMRFYQSTRGLEVGAPIDFQGIHLGVVDSVELRYDRVNLQLYTKVTGTLYPARLGPAFDEFSDETRDLEEVSKNLVRFVNRGLRAQLRSSNVLSGSGFIALGFHDTPLGTQQVEAKIPFSLPTVPSESLEDLQKQIASIVTQLERIPFESIVKNLDEGLKDIAALTRNLDTTLAPELNRSMKALQKTLADLDVILASSDRLPEQVERSMLEMDRAIRSTRALIDELRAQPNSLIFGVPNPTYSRDTLGD